MAETVIAQGRASISINSQETEARLVFTPDKEGDGWDTAAVNKLIADHHLTAHSDQKRIETFLSKAGRAKTSDPVEIVICQGTEPENGESEKIIWEALPVPGEMAPFQNETINKASPPEIFKTTVEKIKHERKVKKSGGLPFMPAKEETVIDWEKKETRERIDINAKVLDIKYADKGKKIGTVTPAKAGKPGKSVFGNPIQQKTEGDGTWLLGDGIAREKNDLSALASGFVRIGENWADIVPLSKPSWSVYTGTDGITPFFSFEPGDPRFAPPSAEEVLGAAAAAGADKDKLLDGEEIDSAIAEAAASREALEAFALFRTMEAEARVDINEDKTKAFLYLRKGTAGALPLEMKAISQAVKDSLVKGFDAEQLKNTVSAFMQGKETELKDYLLAEGKPAARGKDRQIEFSASPLQDEEKNQVLARLKAWTGRDSFKAAGFDPEKATVLAFAEKDLSVANVGAVSEGEEGCDVYGNVIPSLPGNDPEIKLFGGLELRGSSIAALRSGLLAAVVSEKSFYGCVAVYSDAKISLNVSENAMEVTGAFVREEGAGIPLGTEIVLKELAALGIKKGIHELAIEKACAAARAKGSVSGFVIARGEASIAAGGRAVKWLVNIKPSAISDTASYSDAAGFDDDRKDRRGNAVQITAGAPIAELSGIFAEGRAGYDVYGNEIPAAEGSAGAVEHDASVKEESGVDGIALIAACSGELEFDGKEIKICSVKNIDGDLNGETGRINFTGEIKISGNVLAGSAVTGGSHISVSGYAEKALISAGGKAVVALGFKGGGKGVIRAKEGIEAAFTERAAIMAVGDITLARGSILSIIKTNGKLIISSENGKLYGGTCQTRHGINTAHLGSEKGTRTEISFGQDYLVKDQINTLEEEIAAVRQKTGETEKLVKSCRQKKNPIPENVRKEMVRLIKILKQLNIKIFALREKFEEHYESEVRIRGTVFPGVVIESHGRYYEIQQKRSRVVFYFDRETGRIKEKPLD